MFGSDLNAPTYTGTVASSFDPAGPGSLLDGGDLSILTLTANVPTSIATPMRLTDATTSLVGMEAAMIGYRLNGVGSSGHGGTSDDMRWGGTNIIDVYGSPASASGRNIFSTDFDDGTAGNNTIAGSSPTPVMFEATTAPSDSGGPLLVMFNGNWVVAGVLSGGTTANSVYGDISWWTGVAPFHADIESFWGVFVPEPNGLVVLVPLALVLWCVRRAPRGQCVPNGV